MKTIHFACKAVVIAVVLAIFALSTLIAVAFDPPVDPSVGAKSGSVIVQSPASANTIDIEQADVPLGPFNFNSLQFGNSLIESDGGTFSASNWLNTVNADPGNPAYLTGANFNTGIANIGISGSVTYTIRYSTPIVNNTGADFGVVVARFSSDAFLLAVSADGINFTSNRTIAAETAVSSGVDKSYFYGRGGGPFPATLFVHSINLSDFGFAPGASIIAVRITGTTELDLIRAAGFSAPASGVCDIQLNKTTFVNGDTVTAPVLRITNSTAAGLAIEFKFWFEMPGSAPVSFARGGADGSVVLPAGFDQNIGPLTLLSVTAALPRGTYAFNCRFLQPVTGGLLAEDLNSFTIQ